MLSDATKARLSKKAIRAVHASVTSEDLSRPCCEFDHELGLLCRSLSAIAPDVRFDFNMSGERYRIVLPQQLPADAITLMEETPLTITEAAHFHGLF